MNVGALLQGGVARVLRTARAVLNAGADDATPRAESDAGASVATDFSFDAEVAGEEELAQAWQAYLAVRGAAEPLSGCAAHAALDSFLAVFLAHASAWAPTEPNAAQRTPSPRAPSGCSVGHPAALLRDLADAAEGAAAALEAPGAAATPSVSECAAHVQVFTALRVVARSRHNRAVLAPRRVISTLLRAVGATAALLGPPGGAGAAQSATGSALACLAATAAVAALCGFLEAELRMQGRPLRLAALSDVALPTATEGATPNRPTPAPGPAAVEAAEAGAVGVLTNLVGALRRARLAGPADTGGDVPLEAPALRCLAALLVSAPVACGAMLRESGGLEALLDCVGTAPAPDRPAHAELCAQLAALEVCAAAVAVDRESLRRAANVGMFARLGALLRWAGASFSPASAPQPLLSDDRPAPSTPLELLFLVLRILCAGVAEEAGARRTLAERTLITVASVALSATPDPQHRWPGLADHALYFLESLVRAGPLAVAALRGAGAEELLFGPAVFFWTAMDSDTGAAGRRMLRLRAASLLRAIAAAPSWSCGGVRVDLGCEPELAALVRALDSAHAGGDAEGCGALAHVLTDLAATSPERAAAAAVAVAVPAALAGVMARAQERACVAGDDNDEARVGAQCRAALRDAFAAVLSCGSAVRCAAATSAVADTLLNMAWSSTDASAPWALQQLHALAAQQPALARPGSHTAADAAGKGAFYRALAGALPRAQRERPDLLPSLLSLVHVAAALGPGEQAVLAAQGLHAAVVQLLHDTAQADDAAEHVAVAALAALAASLAGCASARRAFAHEPGYAALSAALERRSSAQLTPALLEQLRRLVCDAPGVLPSASVDADVHPDGLALTLRNAGALPVLLACLKRSTHSERLRGLQWLTAVLQSSAAAQCCAAEAALPRALLHWYADASVEAADAAGRLQAAIVCSALADALCACHAATAEDVRAAFALLRRRTTFGRRTLLGALCGAAAAVRDEPRAFFALPGGDTHTETGIHLQLPLRWPPGRPMTFFLWLRVDALPPTDVALLSLRAESGAGILFALGAHGVRVTVFSAAAGAGASPAVVTEAQLACELEPRRWQCMAVVLGAGGLGPLSGERARLFVDGAEVANARMRLPRVLSTTPLTLCAVGAAPASDDWAAPLACFAGQVASPHLFDEALRPSAIAALHACGPDILLEAHAQAAPSAAGEAQDAAARCVLALSAAASARASPATPWGRDDTVCCYNIAPVPSLVVGGRAQGAAAVAAVAGASTAVCVFLGVRDAVRALGGIAALLPLLDDADPDVVSAALRLAAEVLAATEPDHALLAHALRRRGNRVPCSQTVLDAAFQLTQTAGPAVAPAARARLTHDVMLWAACGAEETRVAQAELLIAAAAATPAEVRGCAPPARIFDAVVALDAGAPASVRVRAALLAAAVAQMGAPGVADYAAVDVASLAALVADAHDARCASDAALALAALLAPGAASREALIVAAAALGGAAVALQLLHRGGPSAHAAAVRLLAVLLSLPPDAALPPSGAVGTYGALRQALAPHALTVDVCDALLALATAAFEFQAADVLPGAAAADANAPPPRIVHAAAVGMLLEQLRLCPADDVRTTALAVVCTLVERSVANAAAFVRHRGWQACVLLLLYPPLPQLTGAANGAGRAGDVVEHSSDNSAAPRSSARAELGDSQARPGSTEDVHLARRLLAALHAHCLLRFGGPGGGSELDRTATYVALHASNADAVAGEAAHPLRAGTMPHTVLCEALTDALQLALSPGTRRWGPSVTNNVSAALFLVDELLPVSASLIPTSPAQRMQHGEQPVPAGVWQLCAVACRALANLWPSLQAAAAAANAACSGADTPAPSTPSLRQRALSLLLWTGGGVSASSAEHANAACAHAARLTLRLCLLYVREAPVAEAAAMLALLSPFLPSACAEEERCQLFCSAVAETHRLTALAAAASPSTEIYGRVQTARELLMAAAVAGGFLPAPADAPLDAKGGVHGCFVDGGAADALLEVLGDALSQGRVAAASEAEAIAVRAAVSSRLAAVAALREEMAAAETVEVDATAATLDAARLAVEKLSGAERARRAAANAAADEEAVTQERRLQHALRAVSGERGVWAPAVQTPAHWKVDKAEDTRRRRLRLRRDYRHGTYTDGTEAPRAQHVVSEQQMAAAAKLALEAGAVCAPGHPDGDPTFAADDAVPVPDGSADGSQGDSEGEKGEDDPSPAFAERDAEAAAAAAAGGVAAAAAAAAADELLWTTPATLVTVKRTVPGRLDIHRKHIHFEADADAPAADSAGEPLPSMRRRRRDARWHWRWPAARLAAVHCQRYLLQSRALELFMDDHSSAFLALPSRAAAVRAAAALVRARPGLPLLDKRRKAEAAARAAERWRRREMSNFEYLMTLNTLAGRSYNDLAQYPVLPWVLADYTSQVLDLGAPGALRDLTMPVGALNPARRAALVERYAALSAEGDADIPPFHHGSHYSTPGGVLHWLLRLQPFTALHRGLQGGRFDHGDRLFHSLPAAWAGAWSNAADVRELTPEFFCAPEFLLNGEGHDLGARQDGAPVHHVTLPPWARGDAAAFVRANAAALECEAVSAQLDAWVDLVFGAAQRGPAAVAKLNVFYHLTYEGAVDLERVSDEHARAALADQIALFGQTPAQLFTRKHPSRDAPLWPPAALRAAAHGAPARQPLALLAETPALLGAATPAAALHFLCLGADGRVLAVCADGSVAAHRLVRPSPAAGAFTFSAAAETGYALGPDASATSAAAGAPGLAAGALPPFAASVPLSGTCFATLAGGRLLLSAAHWDARLRVLRAAPGEDVRPLQALAAHADLVTCVAAPAGPACGVCVTGSRDTTLCVWDLATPLPAAAPPPVLGTAAAAAAALQSAASVASASAPLRASPRCVLSGHDAPVSCVACSDELDLVASASAGDATLVLHALRSGRYLRSLRLPAGVAPAELLLADAAGALVVLLQPAGGGGSELRAFNCNGMALAASAAGERLGALALTLDTHMLLTGGELGVVVLRDAATLQEHARWGGARAPITALCAAADDALLAGTQDGRLLLWGPEPSRRR